jgi:hypothetical protein
MDKRELILVELKNGTICWMAKTALQTFLSREEVSKFQRSGGWFVVGKDKLRDMKNINSYDGVERREAI